MKHLGDITAIHGAEIEPVDVITFGSPCQDLSIAGNGEGLSGKRSGLFVEAVRIIKEMRCKTNGSYPTFAVWENVPGAFSSPKKAPGEDFRIVLELLAQIRKEDAVIPRPPDKWRTVGCIMGNGWSIAWRILDAQFWGVPQRRRRIALIMDFGGGRAPEILFVRKSMCGDFETGGKARERTAATAERGIATAGFNGWSSIMGGIDYQNEKSPCLRTKMPPNAIHAAGFQGKASPSSGSVAFMPDGVPTLMNGRETHVMCTPDIARTLTARFDGSPCPERGQGANVIATQSYCIAGNIIGRELQNGANGIGVKSEVSYTLTEVDRHAVMCMGTGQSNTEILHDVSPTLNCDHEQPICLHPDISGIICASGAGTDRPAGQGNEGDLCIVTAVGCRNATENGSVNGTLQAKLSGGTSYNLQNVCRVNHVVRRLTPLECERLQGFPDGWTNIQNYINSHGKRKTASDAERYRALGNSIALPPWKWLLKRISAQFERDATLGSLFDGIAGFPLIWEQVNGKGSARWASEIEEFCIAVTKYHFGEE